MLAPEHIKTIGVAGAGVMGQGIAAVAAQAGYDVLVFDTQQASLDKASKALAQYTAKAVEKKVLTDAQAAAMQARTRYTTDLTTLVADLVIEAAPEVLPLKHALFKQLEAQNSPDAILATNTSSLSVTVIAACLQKPERCVGMHFFNPATLMKLVEIVAGERTDAQAVKVVEAIARGMGKTTVRTQDTPGFIVNRVARHYYLEGMRIAESGAASMQGIDQVLEWCGFKMGPFKLMDLIGNDTNNAVTHSLYNAFLQEPRFRPSRLQQSKVDAGKLGRKTGEGFYKYS